MPTMNLLLGRLSTLSLMCVLSVSLTGCGGAKPATPATVEVEATDTKPTAAVEASSEPSPAKPKMKFDAVTLGSDSATSTTASAGSELTDAEKMESVVQALQPLQIMLGKWRGITNQKFKGFSASEELEWIWDFRTDRGQPALIVTSDKSPYIREGRLTYLPQEQVFQFKIKNPEGVEHVMRGKFEREPEEFTGDDNKSQRTYKLVLIEDEPQGDEAWQIAFDHQENNRYLLKLSRKRGGGQFQLADTVGTQRLGTSFAASDEDYGDRKCIISGGLGTSTVSYNGKTYWVCCSGCQAAFNDDPKRWLAKMEQADKAKKN